MNMALEIRTDATTDPEIDEIRSVLDRSCRSVQPVTTKDGPAIIVDGTVVNIDAPNAAFWAELISFAIRRYRTPLSPVIQQEETTWGDLQEIGIDGIVKAVLAEHPGVTWSMVQSPSRERTIVNARMDCIVAIRHGSPNIGLIRLGKIFNRDHTSIMHLIRRANKMSAAYIDPNT